MTQSRINHEIAALPEVATNNNVAQRYAFVSGLLS
jgi:hypothetical protein